MHTRLTRNLTIESSLREALGTSQLSLVYQPIVELDTGRRSSVEALIRWNHPVLGAVGVSGDTSDNDEICAVAGIEAVGLKANAG
jgi:predicted signal transduction protein with EAL and GGDEF domain